MDHVSQLCITCLCFESHMNHDPTAWSPPVLIIRPLPEEEELEDELFAGTSEEGDPGNENNNLNLCNCDKWSLILAMARNSECIFAQTSAGRTKDTSIAS